MRQDIGLGLLEYRLIILTRTQRQGEAAEMLIYEVNVTVDEDIAAAYAGWLSDHIQKVMTIKGFSGAQWFFRVPGEEGLTGENKKHWTVHYMVESKESLDDYLATQAAALRQEAIDRFGGKFTVERRILHLLSVAVNPEELARFQQLSQAAESANP